MTPSPDLADHPARVLIVDDERQNRQLLEVMLAPEGFDLRAAASGEEALAMVAQQPPDLILLDIMMPGMDGYQVASRIKGDLATRNIPVIMITALDDRDARMRGLNAGAEDFLAKPVDRAELCVRVKNLLRLKAYGDYHDKYSQMLEGEVGSRTADLVESERLYRSTFEAAPVGIVHVGLDGQWLRVNQSVCDLLGYSREELQSGAVQELVRSGQVAGEAESFRQMALGTLDRHVVDDKRYRRRDGSVVWARVNMSVHRDASGQPQHFISVIEDITERRAADAQRERLAALVEASPDFIGFADAKTAQIQYINKHGRRMCGIGEDEDIDKLKLSDVHPAWMNTRLAEVILPAAVRDGLWEGEGAFLHRDGHETPVSMALMARKTVDGELDIFYTVSRDITERREAEAQFLQAQKMETVGRLAGGIAHDFNNLLTVINGTAELAAMDLREDDPLRTEFEEIHRAGDRAAALTRQLLAFSRKQIMKLEALNLSTRVADLQGMLQRLIGEDIALVVRPARHLGSVMADPVQIEQVVMNLAVNARDAMPNGGTLIIETRDVALDAAYAAAHPSVQPGPYVMLAISDTGAGMDEATRRRVFEPFFTTKDLGKGTGLGLSTVYGIVKQSGGSIWVRSEPGKGTTFEIYLPRVGAVAPHGQPAPTVPLGHGTETILIVEDEKGVRHLARRVLQSAGYTVLAAGSGREALLVLEQHEGPVHLVLTDMVMPGMSGRDLVARIEDIRPRMRVVYTSGYTDETILNDGLLDKATGFIGKPYTAAQLTSKVRDVLDSPDGR